MTIRYAMAVIVLSAFTGLVACEKVDQAIETVDKVKALKTDVEKKFNETKKDLTGKAEEITEKLRKDVGTTLPKGREGRSSEREGKKENEDKQRDKEHKKDKSPKEDD